MSWVEQYHQNDLHSWPGVIELDKIAGEPMEILINEKLVAMGEVVVVNEKFGVRLTDVVSQFGLGDSRKRIIILGMLTYYFAFFVLSLIGAPKKTPVEVTNLLIESQKEASRSISVLTIYKSGPSLDDTFEPKIKN